jgi:hypothetical protein
MSSCPFFLSGLPHYVQASRYAEKEKGLTGEPPRSGPNVGRRALADSQSQSDPTIGRGSPAFLFNSFIIIPGPTGGCHEVVRFLSPGIIKE